MYVLSFHCSWSPVYLHYLGIQKDYWANICKQFGITNIKIFFHGGNCPSLHKVILDCSWISHVLYEGKVLDILLSLAVNGTSSWIHRSLLIWIMPARTDTNSGLKIDLDDFRCFSMFKPISTDYTIRPSLCFLVSYVACILVSKMLTFWCCYSRLYQIGK